MGREGGPTRGISSSLRAAFLNSLALRSRLEGQMADERSRLRSYSITPARRHVSGLGTAPWPPGKRLLLPPGPEASPPAGRRRRRRRAPHRAGAGNRAPGLFPTQLHRAEGPARPSSEHVQPRTRAQAPAEPRQGEPAPLRADGTAASHPVTGLRAPAAPPHCLTLPGRRRRPPQSLRGQARPSPALTARTGAASRPIRVPPPGGLRRAPPAPHRSGDAAPGHPDKGGAQSAGRRVAPPRRHPAARRGREGPSPRRGKALPLRRLPRPPSSHNAGQPPAPRGLLPRALARRRATAQPLRAASAFPPAPGSPARVSSEPLRLLPLPAAGCGREPRAGDPPPPPLLLLPRRGSRPRRPAPAAPTAPPAPDTKRGRSNRQPWHPTRRPGHAPRPSLAGPAAAPPLPAAPLTIEVGLQAGPEIASALNATDFVSKTPKLLPRPLLQGPVVAGPVELCRSTGNTTYLSLPLPLLASPPISYGFSHQTLTSKSTICLLN
ncbi:translation initiation factor IF-2-like isoform X1 [Falco rusticolus]|uniref:translation initiation factor IF-2-like n=1 Tax=Falco cherrug TaxID=345164 RepID=UPI00188692AF|nr:translation initiation factor IF-2-like isoform X1 [Falco rusticolus]XP_055573938.1 translation initiation factor IF-2-like [Falco cherrug]